MFLDRQIFSSDHFNKTLVPIIPLSIVSLVDLITERLHMHILENALQGEAWLPQWNPCRQSTLPLSTLS
jgi:hypothetical protein